MTSFWNRTCKVLRVRMTACAVVGVLTKSKSDQELEGLVWNRESQRFPETLLHNMRGIRNQALWWAAITIAVCCIYLRYW